MSVEEGLEPVPIVTHEEESSSNNNDNQVNNNTLPIHDISSSIRVIRSLKGKNTTSYPTKPSNSLQKKKDMIYEYILTKVDPLMGKAVTHLLLSQPDNIILGMKEFLQNYIAKLENNSEETPIDNQQKDDAELAGIRTGNRVEMKLFAATRLHPLMSKLLNRVSRVLPEDPARFFLQELDSIEEEEKMLPDIPSPTKQEENTNLIVSTPFETSSSPSSNELTTVVYTINIAVLGVSKSGKTTFLNTLQGKFDPRVKSTIGFRPVKYNKSVVNDTEEDKFNVTFYDIGGGKNIRGIWNQYYHDISGVIYLVDSSIEEAEGEEGTASDGSLNETLNVCEETLSHPLVAGKPLLILLNKQSSEKAKNTEYWQNILPIPETFTNKLFIVECDSYPIKKYKDGRYGNAVEENEFEKLENEEYEKLEEGQEVEDFDLVPMSNIDEGINLLLNKIKENYSELQERVKVDSEKKKQEEIRLRLEKEKKVLMVKIATAFYNKVSDDIKNNLNLKEDPENVFTQEEGEEFLLSELGEELLEDHAKKDAALTGYHRLALQIIGGLKKPISKKKQPMEWDQIEEILLDIWKQLGLE